MSEIKVNKISPRTNCGTVTLGDSGDTITIPAGVTITNNGTQTGFGRSGSVDWQTTPKTTTFTAANGEGYFVDTSSGAVTANLPAGSAGAIVAFADYTRTFNDNNLTISPNGSNKIGGVAEDLILNVNGQALTLVYVDSTEGWINVQNAEDTETGSPPFIIATGGTITTSGNCKIHTFTGPGSFVVCNAAGTCGPTRNLVSYLVVAGGGGGGGSTSSGIGGGGAGGYREVVSPNAPYTGSPLQGYPTSGNRVTVTATSFPITVGAGGATSSPGPTPNHSGSKGSSSIFSTITSTGGGGGVNFPAPCRPAISNGGSGGGSAGPGQSAGTGNTPPVTPAQGTNGSTGTFGGPHYSGGGGGGASEAGQPGPGSAGGRGGAGTPSQIPGSGVSYAGGGGGGVVADGGSPTGLSAGAASPCGTGGAGGGPTNDPGTAGTTNRGGGGGGAGGYPQVAAGGTGGSGIVIIRYKYQ